MPGSSRAILEAFRACADRPTPVRGGIPKRRDHRTDVLGVIPALPDDRGSSTPRHPGIPGSPHRSSGDHPGIATCSHARQWGDPGMSECAVRSRCGDLGKRGGVWEAFGAILMGFTQTHEGSSPSTRARGGGPLTRTLIYSADERQRFSLRDDAIVEPRQTLRRAKPSRSFRAPNH